MRHIPRPRRLQRRIGISTLALFGASVTISSVPVDAIGCTLATTSGSYGSGYAMATEADLLQMGATCGMSSTYYLTADITMTPPTAGQSNHTPIGSDGNRFNGYFIGQNYTIDGLVIEGGTSNEVGFFGVLGDWAAVEEISFTNARVAGGDRVGILAGSAYLNFPWKVTIDGSATGANSVGGLFGYMKRGTADYITADVTVIGTGTTGKVGGLVGATDWNLTYGARLKNLDVTATVTSAGSDVGGVAGWLSEDTDIGVAIVDVDVDGDGDNVGGVFGSSRGYATTSLTFDGWGATTSATGTVTGGGDYVGGVGGKAVQVDTLAILDVDVDVTMTGATPSFGGGLFGYHQNGWWQAPATFSGTVNAPTADHVGGIFGMQQGPFEIAFLTVDNSITGHDNVGGIAGSLGSGSHLQRLHSTATVVGNTNVGGIAGTLDGTPFDVGGYTGVVSNASVKSSKSGATVTGTTNVGGLVGRTLDSTITLENVYSEANVTGTTNVGGLIGYADAADGSGTTTVIDSYVAGVTVKTGGTADPLIGGKQADVSLTTTDLYFDTDRTGLATSSHGTAGDGSTLTLFSTFDTATWSIADGWSNGKAWGICGPQNDGYPFLVWEVATANACLEAPTWSDDELAELVIGEPFDDGVAATGSAPITYAISAGTLPDGLSLDTATGAITGTPTTEGTYDFTVSATNVAATITVQFTGTLAYPDPDVDISLEFGVGDNIRNGDQTTTVFGSGLRPNSAYTVVLRSDPVTIGSGTADAFGRFEAELTIPADTPAGAHSATVYGIAPDGTPMSDVSYFTLDENGRVHAVSELTPTQPVDPTEPDDPAEPLNPTLPETGTASAAPSLVAALVLLAGWTLVRISRTRRRTVTH